MLEKTAALPRAALSRTMTILLAGGQGSRLHELTSRTCKPALPIFATGKGPLRMVDFTMANAARSGLPQLIAATQYRPEALEAHLDRRWAPLFPNCGLQIRNGVRVRGASGYGGTADAVSANADLIDAAGAEELLVLSGDHIYQMDYSAMIAAHRAGGAVVTLAVHRVPVAEASSFGVVQRGADGRIVDFVEKPAQPQGDPDDPTTALVSMGVYVFDWAWLRSALDTGRTDADFGHDILPLAVETGLAAAYALPAMPGQAAPYWRDVGTLQSLRETLLEFSGPSPCAVPVLPGAPFRLSGIGPDRAVAAQATLVDSVILPGAMVMPGARLTRAIVAPGTVVPSDITIGEEPDEDDRWFRRSADGTVLVSNAMLAQRAGHAIDMLRGPLLTAFNLSSVA